jgi:prophage tail gpP-like protein
MKIWLSILTLLTMLASPAIYAADADDGKKDAATETSGDGKKGGKAGEEEPDCD